jgi:ABC-2 type transport system permease protein
MMSNIIILLTHDLAVAFKNKTLYLIICIPLFVFATMTLVDPASPPTAKVTIGLLRTGAYAPMMLNVIKANPGQFDICWISNTYEASRLLKEHKVNGILMPDSADAARLLLVVNRQTSLETLTIVQRMSALQTLAEGKNPDWIAAVRPLQESSIKQQTLPTWILMMLLLISFIVLPAQVAEEKEKQLFLGWMQTPIRESEWLVSKVVYGMVLLLSSVASLQLMGKDLTCTHGLSYLLMLCTGGFCFGSLGIFLGLLCRHQASARTLGVLCYLPLLLPAALSDMSQTLGNIAPFLPSYHFYAPIQSMIADGSGLGTFIYSWISLVVMGLCACLASHHLLKKRWLMS